MEGRAMDERMREGLELYTPEEAAELLKVTRRTMYSYLRGGAIRSAKLGRVWRIARQDIEAFLSSGREAAESARASRTAGPSA